MRKILYTSLNGFPNPHAGGGNRIIYEILSSTEMNDFSKHYFSSIFSHPVLIDDSILNDIDKSIKQKKKIGFWLSNKISLYREITSSDIYKKKHIERSSRNIGRRLKSLNIFDIIHSHDSLATGFCVELKHPKKILTIHSKGAFASELNNGFKKNYKHVNWINKIKEIEKINYYSSDLVTFPSKSAEKYFLDDLNISKQQKPRTEIVYNGIDLDRLRAFLKTSNKNIFRKYGIPVKKDQLVIINIAEHVTEKNIPLLIKTVDLLNHSYDKDSLLINIGEGRQTDTLKKLCSELSVNEKVFFLGKINNEDVIKLLKESDLLIMPGEKVVFDLVVLEAMAVGTTVVASKIGGNIEIIEDRINGYFIEYLHAEEITKIILQIQPGKVRENALRTSEKFSKLNMTKKYLELYNQL